MCLTKFLCFSQWVKLQLSLYNKGQFECLGGNTEKYKTFSVLIENGHEDIITTSYKIKCIDSARIIANSLLTPVDILTERIHKIKCTDCDCFLEYGSVKGSLLKYKCSS